MLSAIPYTFSLYSSEEEGSFDVVPHKFYFESDMNSQLNYIDGMEFDININNFLSDNFCTYDITFTVDVDNVNVGLTDSINNPVTGGTLTGGIKSTFIITVTPDSGVTSFIITVQTTNGFAKTLSATFSVV